MLSFRDDINELQNRFDIIPRGPTWVPNKGFWSHLESTEGKHSSHFLSPTKDTMTSITHKSYAPDDTLKYRALKTKGFLNFGIKFDTIYDSRNKK